MNPSIGVIRKWKNLLLLKLWCPCEEPRKKGLIGSAVLTLIGDNALYKED